MWFPLTLHLRGGFSKGWGYQTDVHHSWKSVGAECSMYFQTSPTGREVAACLSWWIFSCHIPSFKTCRNCKLWSDLQALFIVLIPLLLYSLDSSFCFTIQSCPSTCNQHLLDIYNIQLLQSVFPAMWLKGLVQTLKIIAESEEVVLKQA